MRFIVIGNGKMAVDALATLRATSGAEIVMCVGDPYHEARQSRLSAECVTADIPYLATRNINYAEIVSAMRAASPDYLLSVNNFQIFKAPSLAIPRLGVLNFHNGPLPRYGGLNACSWALFNGEIEHGVTWHLVDGGIDSGPIIRQSRFAIDPEETAIGLIGRCIREGAALLQTLASDLVAGVVQPIKQDKKHRLYFGLKDRPWGGNLPWWLPASEVKRISRALSFHPMPNMFYRPKLAVDVAKPLFAERVEVRDINPNAVAGTIVEVLDDEISVALPDSVVRLGGLYHDSGESITAQDITEIFNVRRGQRLTSFAA